MPLPVALQCAHTDRGWSVASALEVTDTGTGLATEEERMYAAKTALLRQKVAEAKKKLAGQPG